MIVALAQQMLKRLLERGGLPRARTRPERGRPRVY